MNENGRSRNEPIARELPRRAGQIRHAEGVCDPPANTQAPQGRGDVVNHPQHYTNGGVECIQAIESATNGLSGFEGLLTGQCIKYLWRWKHKGKPLEDLRKCRWYLDRLISLLDDRPADIEYNAQKADIGA